MFAVLALAAAIDASPAPACAGADIAVTAIRIKLIKKSKAPDHYIITGTVANRGAKPQEVGVTQRVELVRDGRVLAPQPLPALGAGVSYDVAFAIDRPAAQRRTPLPVTLRYVLQKGDSARNNCSGDGNTRTQTF